MDANSKGRSVPKMMGASGQPTNHDESLAPGRWNCGFGRVMSMALCWQANAAVIWPPGGQ